MWAVIECGRGLCGRGVSGVGGVCGAWCRLRGAKGVGLVSKVDRYIYYNFQPTPQTGNELFYTYVSSGYE